MDCKAVREFCENKKIEYKALEPMSLHTSFKIGGNADLFVLPTNKAMLCDIIGFLNENKTPYFILGKGSNLLVSDKGIEGVVISLLSLNDITVNGNIVKADAGASLAAVCKACLENDLTGLEFAYGIPGTVGGALYMNAGAYGGEMSMVVTSAEVLTADGKIESISASDMALGYRTSCFKENGAIILSVSFMLKKGNSTEIKALMEDFLSRRKDKQPLEYPSAGSTFKRGIDFITAKLIDECGLKGYQIGGAQISEKHAGFIINKENATAEDVIKLMEYTKEQIYNKFGKVIEAEIEIIK